MKIIPMRNLKNTKEIEQLCKESKEPVFVTKNGTGSLIVLDFDTYADQIMEIYNIEMIKKGHKDYLEGRTIDGPTALKALKNKYGKET